MSVANRGCVVGWFGGGRPSRSIFFHLHAVIGKTLCQEYWISTEPRGWQHPPPFQPTSPGNPGPPL